MFRFTLLFLFIVLWSAQPILSKPVPLTTVEKVAHQFFNQKWAQKQAHLPVPSLKLTYTERVDDDTDVFYVFSNPDGKGYIIVSSDDNYQPVLGYSLESAYTPHDQNPAFKNWLSGYKDEILHCLKSDRPQNIKAATLWAKYLNNDFVSNRNQNGVDPLCSAMFDQSPYVNDQTPYDNAEQKRCVTGCPATAMSIIMARWAHPEHGTGFHAYKHPKYGSLSVNYANTTYDWSLIPDTIREENSEIAKVMYHCGVAVEMEYTPSESGAYILIDSPTPMANCEYAYKTYFGYSQNVRGLYREDYQNEAWLEILKNDLDLGHPIQYAGFGAGGHTFVCDGYDDDNYFHMNWGWGGAENGWFLLDELSPGSGGIGSGEGTYNNGQQAIVGIRPVGSSSSSAPKLGITLASDIQLSTTNVSIDSAFTINFDLAFSGNEDYVSDVTVLIFNDHGVYVDYVDVKDSITFSNGNAQSFTFESQGISALPGNYSFGVYGSEPSDSVWHLIRKGNFVNPIDINIKALDNALFLDNALTLSSEEIIENTNFFVTTTVKNTGSEAFNGKFSFGIYDHDGEWLGNFVSDTTYTLQSDESKEIIFEIVNAKLVSGTYFLAISGSEDDTNYHFLSQGVFANPTKFVVIESPLTIDEYENNNNSLNAYRFALEFENDKAIVTTQGSNFHIPNDVDFYRIDFESGYEYKIEMQLHDQHNNADNESYSVDGYFTYDKGQGPSSHIHGTVTTEDSIKGAGFIIFKTSPYFVGFVGTYLLDVSVTRKLISKTNELEVNGFTIYPNPANQMVTIHDKNQENKPLEITVVNSFGITVMQAKMSINAYGDAELPIHSLPDGQYILWINNQKRLVARKLVVMK